MNAKLITAPSTVRLPVAQALRSKAVSSLRDVEEEVGVTDDRTAAVVGAEGTVVIVSIDMVCLNAKVR